MTRYAYVENNEVQGVYGTLPQRWKNVSNFHLLSEEMIREYGFYPITTASIPTYDPEVTEASQPTYSFTGDGVLEHVTLTPRPQSIRNIDAEWQEIRRIRDQKIRDIEWRMSRAQREIRQGLRTTDDVALIDRYIQELTNIPQTFSDPRDVVWPVYGA